jgi:hypothetical protein
VSVRREPWMRTVCTFSSAGQPSPAVSRARAGAARAPCHAQWAGPVAHGLSEPHWPGRAAAAGVGCMAAFGPLARAKIRIPFLFSFSFNFENSYLPVQRSKNHETNSVGFINSISIQ